MRKLLLGSAALMSVLWLGIVATQTPTPKSGGLAGALLSDPFSDGYGIHAGVTAQHR